MNDPSAERRRALKADAVERCARAEYEAMKEGVVELWETTWPTLPDADGELPTPRCKQYYRERVSLTVETLARAHMLAAASPEGEEGRLREAGELVGRIIDGESVESVNASRRSCGCWKTDIACDDCTKREAGRHGND